MKSFKEYNSIDEGFITEEFDYIVKVEGLPDMYMKAKASSEIKKDLRKILRDPNTLVSVERILPTDLKKIFRAKVAGSDLEEGSETWEAGYKRRVVKTTKPEHKEKGMNWRIKGKDRPEISIKLYKEKPSQQEFNKQMRRVAGHEFGG